MKSNSLKRIFPLTLVVSAGIVVFGCAGPGGNRTASQPIDDQTLNLRVESALRNVPEELNDVRVMTHRATVQLTGSVSTPAEKRQAADIARGMDGVRRVENYIEVRNQSAGE